MRIAIGIAAALILALSIMVALAYLPRNPQGGDDPWWDPPQRSYPRRLGRASLGSFGAFFRGALAMRILIGILLAVVIMAALPHTPATAQPICETLGCSTECYYIGNGIRRCHRRCQRRCWHAAPRYEPRYEPPPQYHPPRRYEASTPFPLPDGAAIFIFLAGMLGLIAVLSVLFPSPSIDDEIAKAEKSAASARTLASDADAQAKQIDAFVEDTARDHFQRGRRAAEKEWSCE